MKSKNESNNKILLTMGYSKFRHFPGNRDINERNIKKIMDSVQKIGWITNPIIVNEKMEVVDGQHRLEVLKRMDLPVEYIVVPGITPEVIRQMNDKQFRWKMNDFAKSFADEGRTSYLFVYDLMKKFDVNADVVMRAANKKNFRNHWDDGDLLFTTDDYRKAEDKLEKFKTVEQTFAEHRKHNVAFTSGVFFLIEHDYDLKEIAKSETRNRDTSIRFYTVKMFLEYIEKIYNYRRSADKRIYPVEEFKKTESYMKNKSSFEGK